MALEERWRWITGANSYCYKKANGAEYQHQAKINKNRSFTTLSREKCITSVQKYKNESNSEWMGIKNSINNNSRSKK